MLKSYLFLHEWSNEKKNHWNFITQDSWWHQIIFVSTKCIGTCTIKQGRLNSIISAWAKQWTGGPYLHNNSQKKTVNVDKSKYIPSNLY